MPLPINKKPDKTSKAGLTTEQTKGQTAVQVISIAYGGDDTLTRDYSVTGTYAELRALRRDPTTALARSLIISCIQAGSWTVEADDDVPDDRIEFMKHVLSLRDDFIGTTVAYGLVDYGWQGYEKIYQLQGDKIVIEQLKPLLHDFTTILITVNGRFNGYRQRPNIGDAIDLNTDKCFHAAFGVEAGGLYGRPLLADVHAASDMWGECNDGAKRYDKKMAGSHWLLTYPPGTSIIDGVVTENSDIAAEALAAFTSGGSMALPTTMATVLQEITNDAVADLHKWSVELISDQSPRQESFGKRLGYLDTLKVRGLRMPERSILEGNFGTKAESVEHGDWAVTHLEAVDRQIVSMVNNQLVNPLLAMNYGDDYRGKIKLTCTPLVDEQVGFLRDVYKESQHPNLDTKTLGEKLDLPQTDEITEVPNNED